MLSTPEALRRAAGAIKFYGLHTGDQFIAAGSGALDVCAAIYLVAENGQPPTEFFTDEVASLEIISASAPAMAAIRALSDSLPTEASFTEVYGHEIPDHIEHVCNWAATRPAFGDRPPTVSEVIDALLRAANTVSTPANPMSAQRKPGPTDARGLCITCGGHGCVEIGRTEIPFEELSPRRQQGYAAGHRFHRSSYTTCPDCDGQDRATVEAEQAAGF